MEFSVLTRYTLGMEKSPIQESKEEQTVKEYIQNLGLVGYSLSGKKVLDVGSGAGAFVRFVNQNDGDAIGVDNGNNLNDATLSHIEKTKTPFVLAEADDMPFDDSVFDLVVSHAAIPNIASENFKKETGPRKEWAVSQEEDQQRRIASLKEMLRVVTESGEVRCAPVVRDLNQLKYQTLKIIEAIEKIKEYADVVEEPISETKFRLILRKKKQI